MNEPLRSRDPAIVAFERELYEKLRELSQAGLGQEAVATLAAVLQEHVADDTLGGGRMSHSEELELVLRAVLAILKGSEDGRYIASTLQVGVFRLVSSLYRSMPSFAERVKEDKWLQAILGDYYRPANG